MGEVKLLSEITRKEWIKYQWVDVTQFGDARKMLQIQLRTPDEAMNAMMQWDSTAEERDALPVGGESEES